MSGVGQRIQTCRERLRLSKTELASRSGLTVSAISQFESGDRDPSLESLVKLADAFGVATDYLVGRENEMSDANMSAVFRKVQKMGEEERAMLLFMYEFLQSKQHKLRTTTR